MNYIILDLEWNQAYLQKALAVQKRLCARLHGEVIQIGAVKLGENLDFCGSYSIIVKPRYFTKIHRHVMLLTGITQSKMDAGVPLEIASESFKKFCGDDFAFLTWGPDDIPMLKENFNVNKLDTSWLDRVYDLQSIYSSQILGERRQVSLEDAMSRLGIEQTLPAHDALNDAYFTALVAKHLDISRGIREYNPYAGKMLFERTIGDADVGETGYERFTELESYSKYGVTQCPLCNKPMKRMSKTLHMKGQRYITHMSCEEHSDMIVSAKLSRNFDNSYRIRFTVDRATEEQIKHHYELIAEHERIESMRRKHRGKSRRHSPQKKVRETQTVK